MAGLAVYAAIVATIAISIRLFYLRLLPRPIAGGPPFNLDSAKRILGDAPYFIELDNAGEYWLKFFTQLLSKHNTPIAQFFPGPLDRTHIVIADYREARDLMSKRGKDLGRGVTNDITWNSVIPGHFISMEDSHPSFKDTKFLTKDLMTPSFLHGVNDGGAATLLNDVRLNKTESPDSATWNDLVFPSFDSVGSPDDEYHILKLGGSNQKFNFSIEVPSLRPRLFCHPATVRDRGVSTTGGAVSTTITAIDLLPETCRAGDDSQVRNVSFKATGDKTDGLVGLFFDLDIGVLVSKQCSPCKTNPDSARPYNPMGCPSIGIFFAERPFVCSQVVQQVRVGMKFTSLIGPKGEIIFQRSSLTSTPTPNESTAKNLTRDDSELDLFPYRIQPHFDKNVTNSISDDPADPFFRYILSGTTGVSRDDLTKNPDQLIDVVNGLYTKFMVQVMDSSIFRTPIVASTQTKEQNEKQSVNGTISREEFRLIMNYTPKLILQILLGTMMILGLTAYIMVDLKGTLPRSPHSIASSMALFAGSELCANHIPEEAEWMNKQQLDRIFQGYTFALGWWSRSATEADSRSIDSLLDAPVVDERFGIDVGTPERLGFEAKGNRGGRLWSKWSAL